jgi:DNA-binding transcriptional LysR family regulator
MSSLRYDLIDLRLFINVVEAGNLTRGAERSSLSLAAASMRMKNLEEALGTQLLVRGAQGVTPTLAGEALLAHAVKLYQQIERLHGDLQVFSQGLKGRIRIFANTTAITEILPAALGQFLVDHPQIDIDLEERLSPEIARAVADGLVDIGILAGSVQTDRLDVMPYQRDTLVLATWKGHRLAGRGTIDFSEALGEKFVSLHRGSAIHGFLDDILSAAGATSNVRIRVSAFEALCRMVEARVGIGVIPASVARRLAASHEIAIVALSDDWARRELKICVQDRATLPVFARELVDYLLAYAP